MHLDLADKYNHITIATKSTLSAVWPTRVAAFPSASTARDRITIIEGLAKALVSWRLYAADRKSRQ